MSKNGGMRMTAKKTKKQKKQKNKKTKKKKPCLWGSLEGASCSQDSVTSMVKKM